MPADPLSPAAAPAQTLSPSAENAVRNIKSLARASEIVAGAATLLFAALLGLVLTAAAISPEARAEILAETVGLDAAAAALAQGPRAALAMAVGVSPILLLIYALWQTRRLLAGYRRGEIFTPAAAARLGRIGWSIVAMAPVAILTTTLAGLALSYDAGAANALSVEVDDGHVMELAFGLLVVVVARVLGEASKISAENDAFV